MGIFRVLATGLFLFGLFLGVAFADTATDFGKSAETWDAEISPDGKSVALGCSPNGTKAICTYDLVGGTKPKLFQPEPDTRLTSFFWLGPEHLGVRINFFSASRHQMGWKIFA